MRILMISDVFFPRINGVSTSISTFTKEFVKQGHAVDLIAPCYRTEDDQKEDWIYRIPAKKIVFDPEDRMMSSSAIRKLLAELKAKQYDVIHIHTPFVAHYSGIWLAKQLQLPVIESYHTFFEEFLYHYVPFVSKWALKFLARKFSVSQCKQIDHIVVPSRLMANVLYEYGIDSAHTIIPTGVNIKRPKQNLGKEFRDKFGISPSQPALVHIGRIAFEKNISFLLLVAANIIKKIPNLVMLIAGEGPAVKKLKTKAKELGIEKNVVFVGYLDRDTELAACYQAGDIFVFASRTETQGLVLLEAILLGVPVVSTAKMGTKDILINGKGALIAKEEVYDFSDMVLKIVKDPLLREILSREGHEYAKAWQPEEMARRMIDLYESLLLNNACLSKQHPAC